jgi:hypothetical protein
MATKTSIRVRRFALLCVTALAGLLSQKAESEETTIMGSVSLATINMDESDSTNKISGNQFRDLIQTLDGQHESATGRYDREIRIDLGASYKIVTIFVNTACS